MNVPVLFDVFNHLRAAFSKFSSFQYFFLLVLGLMGFSVSSLTDIVRYLGIETSKYSSFVQSLEAKSICLEKLQILWQDCVRTFTNDICMTIDGKKILVLDATLIKKIGKRIPETSRQYNHSEGSYFNGFKWELIGLVVKKSWVSVCIPFASFLHTPKDKSSDVQKEKKKQTITIGNWLQKLSHTSHSILVADSWYACCELYYIMLDLQITFVSRVASNAVAYSDPPPRKKGTRGRPRIYGKKVKLKEEFIKLEKFKDVEIEGQQLKARKICLIWEPIKQKAAFVLVQDSSGRKYILFCSDTNMSMENIILAYKARTGVERSFRSLKQEFALSRCKKWFKNKCNIENKKKAHNVYFMACMIAMGITQILSLSFSSIIWSKVDLWLRTINKNLPPSEAVVKIFIENQVISFLSEHGKGLAIWKSLLKENTKIPKTDDHGTNSGYRNYA